MDIGCDKLFKELKIESYWIYKGQLETYYPSTYWKSVKSVCCGVPNYLSQRPVTFDDVLLCEICARKYGYVW